MVPLLGVDRFMSEARSLTNLIGNAVKFTPPTGLVTVRFDALPDGLVQTCVSDTGCGIPPDHLDRVFHEFSKVPSTMPTSQGRVRPISPGSMPVASLVSFFRLAGSNTGCSSWSSWAGSRAK